ncbi:RmlC-like cupin [Colletotrichum eremochloae]|nr:RmlC-like cupin [Colletotrichum eremochloae]
MKRIPLTIFALQLAAAFPTHVRSRADNCSSLILDEAPDSPRPYVLRKGAGQAVQVGSQVYRFSVTGNSSAGAFTLMQTNAPDSTALGVLPHIHKAHYENFYCTKGRFQLWAENNVSGGQQARVLTPGDYGAVPEGTTHTFQITDPDTQMTGVIQPGGFEALFLAIAQQGYSSVIGSEFVPATFAELGLDPSVISSLESLDVFAELDFEPRRDLINGTAGTGNWHNGPNEPAQDSNTPNFIAKNYGPKYLNVDDGIYRVIAPFTANETGVSFTMGTITISPLLSNMTAPAMKTYAQPLAFQMEEGALTVEVTGYSPVSLVQGDVFFLPEDVSFTYYATAGFTKFLYVTGGDAGFESELMQRSASWDYATYPIAPGYTL